MSLRVSVYVVPVTNPNLPAALYLPTGAPEADRSGASIELRHTPDGQTALIAFSTLDKLIDCCGPHQPWLLVRTENLPTIHAGHPYDLIVLDSPLPAELRHTPTRR
jgi:hypothetical protein